MLIASIFRIHISLLIEIPVKFTGDDYDVCSLIRYKSSYPIESRTNYIRYIVDFIASRSRSILRHNCSGLSVKVAASSWKRINDLSKEPPTKLSFRITVRFFCYNIVEIRDR